MFTAGTLVGAKDTPPPSTISLVAWVPHRDLDLVEWSRAAQKLGALDRCSPWWIGDCIRYGNAKFGEKYSRAAKLTGYDAQTLMNRVYVASHIEVSRRRENLSWSHHDAVASLTPDVQDRWLDLATEHKMSVADLRVELRAHRNMGDSRSKPQRPANRASEQDRMTIACPSCGYRIPPEVVGVHLHSTPPRGMPSRAQPR